MTTARIKKLHIVYQVALIVLVCATVFIVSAIPINSHDFWWHLNAGDLIIETGELPGDEDPFTYSVLNSDEHNQKRAEFLGKQYWLSQITFSLTHSLFGLQGIILLRVLLFSTLVLAAFWVARNNTKSLAATILLPLLIFSAAIVLEDTDRPQNFGFLYALLTLLIVEFSIARKQAKLLFLSIPVVCLYANSHAGAVVSICYLGTYLLFSLFEERLRPYKKTLGICVLLSLIAAGLNPNGYQVFFLLLNPAPSYVVSMTAEYNSPISIFLPSLSHPSWFSYWLLVLLAPIAAIHLMIKRNFSACFILVATLTLSLLSIRYIFFFTQAAYLFTAFAFGRTLENSKLSNYFRKNIFSEMGVLALFMLGLLSLHPNTQYQSIRGMTPQIQPEMRPDIFPIAAMNFLKERKPEGNVFNLEAWGGYLEYNLYPDYKFFTDTRNLDENRLKQHFDILNYNETGKRLIEQYDIRTVVIPPIDYYTGAIFNIIREFYRSEEWQLIYFGNNALVFSKDKRFSPIAKSMIYLQTYYQLSYWGQIYPRTPTYIQSMQEAQYFLSKR